MAENWYGEGWDEYGNSTGDYASSSVIQNVGSMGPDWDEYGNYIGSRSGTTPGYYGEDTALKNAQVNYGGTAATTSGGKAATSGGNAATAKTGSAATKSGDTDLGAALNKLLSTGSGIFDLFNKNSRLSMTGITEDATSLADPLRKDRPFYGGMLKELMTDPMSYNLSAPAQFELAQGTENLSRAGAARGLLGSGNLMGEIMKYGQGVASADYWKQVENLGRLSGGTTGNPAAAGNIYGNLYGMRNNAAANIGGGTSGGRPASGTTGGTTTSGNSSGSTMDNIKAIGTVFNAGKDIISSGKDVWSSISSMFTS